MKIARRAPLLMLGSLLVAPCANAAVDLVAEGTISGHYEDFSAATAAPLENGVPGNRLGGMGSGLAWAGGTTFLGLPDRGPNAVTYNAAIDSTASYIDRFHTLNLALSPSDAGSALPLTLTPFVTGTTLLNSATKLVYGDGVAAGIGSGAPELNRRHKFYFTGRSDNFDPAQPSTFDGNGRLDPESIRVAPDGKSVYVTDEYGPYVYQFNRRNGERIRSYPLPAKFAIAHQSSVGDTEISGNTSGRVANKGMEGLALSPDGQFLYGVMQSPLIQDGGTNGPVTRIVRIDAVSGATTEFAYALTNIGTDTKPKYPTVSDIVAVDDHRFLVDERDGKGLGDNSTAVFKQVNLIDLAGAADVSGLSGADLVGKAPPKTLFLDIVSVLGAHGVSPNDVPAKLEGLALGPDVTVGGSVRHTLYVSNDNDYTATVVDSNHPTGIENPNCVFVFAFDDADLGTGGE